MRREQKIASTTTWSARYFFFVISISWQHQNTPIQMWAVELLNAQRDYSRKFKPKRKKTHKAKKEIETKKNMPKNNTHADERADVFAQNLPRMNGEWCNASHHNRHFVIAHRELLLSKFNSTKENANFFLVVILFISVASPVFSWYLIGFVLLNASQLLTCAVKSKK